MKRNAFGNPSRRSQATIYRMNAPKRRMRAERSTKRIVRYQLAMSARTL